MIFIKYMRRLFNKERMAQRMEYVQEMSCEPQLKTVAPAVGPAYPESISTPSGAGKEAEIAFSPQGDLEAYVRELDVSKEAIERWISAGVLLPEETKVATKMIQIMCRQSKPKMH
ncbi:MAG: hypothetical protein C4519_18555 [Desulfobacteraceae bacterium]|nr:MAG: hypothetical protein C4519_18555 [Desulfobacteraceae bacterium]